MNKIKVILSLSILMFLNNACGVKGDPIPPDSPPPLSGRMSGGLSGSLSENEKLDSKKVNPPKRLQKYDYKKSAE